MNSQRTVKLSWKENPEEAAAAAGGTASLFVWFLFFFLCVCNFLVPEDELVKMNIFFITAGRYSPYTFSHYTFFFYLQFSSALKNTFNLKPKLN